MSDKTNCHLLVPSSSNMRLSHCKFLSMGKTQRALRNKMQKRKQKYCSKYSKFEPLPKDILLAEKNYRMGINTECIKERCIHFYA